jgi:stearoyl-CoA desaturase (Delta-9 desaturase)
VTHITIVAVTVYLHRGMAHRSLRFSPVLSHFFRFWLWLTTGMITREWVAVHRQHHQKCERSGDPHSPHVHGLWRVLFCGAWLYNRSSKNTAMVNNLSRDVTSDWIENNIYSKFPFLGIIIMLLINLILFQWWGLVIWAIQMIWIPFWAAGVVNGIGHWWGYRNGQTGDCSTNISPWGIIIGGEELHNGHHLDPTNPKLSQRWFEFDIGWMYICILRFLRLVKLRDR